MKILHCNLNFKPYDTWFLYDTATDKNRRLLLGKCPNCKKDVVALIEERKSDGKIYNQIETGAIATKLIDNAILKKDIVISASEIAIKKGKPFGLCYGENKEIHNTKGQVVAIRQRRCDWFGQKEILKEIKT